MAANFGGSATNAKLRRPNRAVFEGWHGGAARNSREGAAVSETRIQRSALVPRDAADMFRLVCAVEDYPEYMDGCVGAEVYSRSHTEMRARLDLGKAGLRYSFVTRNLLHFPAHIELLLEEGPFKRFHGDWRFARLGELGCKVSLDLRFEMNHRLLSKPAEKLFTRVANNLVQALVERAAKHQAQAGATAPGDP